MMTNIYEGSIVEDIVLSGFNDGDVLSAFHHSKIYDVTIRKIAIEDHRLELTSKRNVRIRLEL